jgi:putative transposase
MLSSNNHSVFKLHYHLIMCIKYRHEVITDPISKRLKDIFVGISSSYNIILNEWEHNKDHVHCLIEGHPNSSLSKFINAYKSASSRL